MRMTVNPPKLRTCVFCHQSGALTKEHVYPQWIWRQYGQGKRPSKYVDEGPSRFLESTARGAEDFVHQFLLPANNKPNLHPTGLAAKAVCGPCNNGWMSALETRFSEIISSLKSGRTWRPSAENIRDFRRWALKTILLYEQAEPEIKLANAAAYAAVHQDVESPGTFYLGLARVGGEYAFSIFGAPLATSTADPDLLMATNASGIKFATGFVIGIAGILLIARYSPYETRKPARLDHDFVRRHGGAPVTLADSTRGRPIQVRGLPYFSEEEIDDFRYWGHPRNLIRAFSLLGSGSERWIGQTFTAEPDELATPHHPEL